MKSHVSMEQYQCVVCRELFDTGTVLLDKRLRASMEAKTVTGHGMCPTHEGMRREGYIALIEATPERVRLGRLAHIRSEAWDKIFKMPAPPGGAAYVPPEVMDHLSQIGGVAEASA